MELNIDYDASCNSCTVMFIDTPDTPRVSERANNIAADVMDDMTDHLVEPGGEFTGNLQIVNGIIYDAVQSYLGDNVKVNINIKQAT